MPTWFAEDPETFVPPPGISRARLVVLSGALSPEAIEARVGMPPDRTWVAGTPWHKRTHPYNGFAIDSGLQESEKPEAHLSALLARLRPAAPRIAALIQDPEIASVRLWLTHHIPNWNPGFSLSEDHIRDLHTLGTGLEIDVYVDDGEPSSPTEPQEL